MTDQDLLDLVQYSVLETPDQGASFPSGLWTAAEVLAYANEQQQTLIREQQLQVGVALISPAALSITQTLPADWIRTVGLLWQASPPAGAWTPVFAASGRELDTLLSSWIGTSGTPLFFADEETGTLTLRVAPAPSVAGRFEVIYVVKGAELDGAGEVLTLPDLLAPALRYRILMRMLSKVGRSLDPARATLAREMAGQISLAAQALTEAI